MFPTFILFLQNFGLLKYPNNQRRYNFVHRCIRTGFIALRPKIYFTVIFLMSIIINVLKSRTKFIDLSKHWNKTPQKINQKYALHA